MKKLAFITFLSLTVIMTSIGGSSLLSKDLANNEEPYPWTKKVN